VASSRTARDPAGPVRPQPHEPAYYHVSSGARNPLQFKGLYDYDTAWTWALAMTREQRQARLAALRESTILS